MTDEQASRPVGRPTIFSQELCDTICERIAEKESLRSICCDDGMPSLGTVMRWLADVDKASFREQYTRAREIQADAHVDEIIDIADTEEDPNKARIRIDARKWSAGKMRPKVYGDKLTTENSTTLEAGDTLSALMDAINGQTRSK